ncbi:MAG: hypothetical protein PVS3B1_38850 [Ktedonobacteraceae bacterium]
MDIVNEIKEILSLHNPDDKENGLKHIIDVFEYGHGLNKADAIEGTKLLLNAALQAQEGMRETFFRAINSAVVYKDIGDQIDWSSLVALLPSLQKVHLEYILNILPDMRFVLCWTRVKNLIRSRISPKSGARKYMM